MVKYTVQFKNIKYESIVKKYTLLLFHAQSQQSKHQPSVTHHSHRCLQYICTPNDSRGENVLIHFTWYMVTGEGYIYVVAPRQFLASYVRHYRE